MQVPVLRKELDVDDWRPRKFQSLLAIHADGAFPCRLVRCWQRRNPADVRDRCFVPR